MVKITIDKPYIFPDIDTIPVRDYILFAEELKSETTTDHKLVSVLLKCEESVLNQLPQSEFNKLVILTHAFLEQKTTLVNTFIPFAPLGSYPFGVFADLKKKIELFNGDERCIPWTIALLRPGVGYGLRSTYWLDWANELPASVGIHYHNKIMAEYVKLCETFKALEGEEPDDNEIKAGIEHLSRYGEYLTMFNLSNKNILEMKKISMLPTNEVLTYICASKDVNTYSSELNRLRKPQ